MPTAVRTAIQAGASADCSNITTSYLCVAAHGDAGALDAAEAPESACYWHQSRAPHFDLIRLQRCSVPGNYVVVASRVYASQQRNSGNMASLLRAKQPASTCCGCCQDSVQLKALKPVRQGPKHSARQQTAICATSTSTNTCVVVRTHRQQRIGVRKHTTAPFGRRPVTLQRAFGENNGSSKDPSLQDYVEVKIESVKVNAGAQNRNGNSIAGLCCPANRLVFVDAAMHWPAGGLAAPGSPDSCHVLSALLSALHVFRFQRSLFESSGRRWNSDTSTYW